MKAVLENEVDRLVEEAHEATKDLPTFDAIDVFRNLLEYVNEKGVPTGIEAAVIRACRKKAGLPFSSE